MASNTTNNGPKVVNTHTGAFFGAAVAFLAATGRVEPRQHLAAGHHRAGAVDARHGRAERHVRHRRGVQGGPRPGGGPLPGQRGARRPATRRSWPAPRPPAWATCDPSATRPPQAPDGENERNDRANPQGPSAQPAAARTSGARRAAGARLGPPTPSRRRAPGRCDWRGSSPAPGAVPAALGRFGSSPAPRAAPAAFSRWRKPRCAPCRRRRPSSPCCAGEARGPGWPWLARRPTRPAGWRRARAPPPAPRARRSRTAPGRSAPAPTVTAIST